MIKPEIGDIAGYIWHYLDKNKEASWKELQEVIIEKHKTNSLFFTLAIGWLLRENNIVITFNNNDYNDYLNAKIRLK